jgi:RNA polymerase sigma-70 factor, ECF subfamily
VNKELICDGGMAMDYPEIGQAEEFSPEQFERFFAATMRPLRSYICRVASNEMIADDILQESYIRLLSAPAMREAQRKSYLYRVATNLIMDHHRAESRQRYWLQRSVVPDESVDSRVDLAPDMRQLFAKISTRERSLLWLAYVEGAEHREIAEILHLKEKGIKVLLHRARRRMEVILRRVGFEGSHG